MTDLREGCWKGWARERLQRPLLDAIVSCGLAVGERHLANCRKTGEEALGTVERRTVKVLAEQERYQAVEVGQSLGPLLVKEWQFINRITKVIESTTGEDASQRRSGSSGRGRGRRRRGMRV